MFKKFNLHLLQSLFVIIVLTTAIMGCHTNNQETVWGALGETEVSFSFFGYAGPSHYITISDSIDQNASVTVIYDFIAYDVAKPILVRFAGASPRNSIDVCLDGEMIDSVYHVPDEIIVEISNLSVSENHILSVISTDRVGGECRLQFSLIDA